jgi:nicotinamide-nucleotide amidase
MLLEHQVLPRLSQRADGVTIRSVVVRTTGIPESTLAERLGDIEREVAPLSLAYLPGLAGVDLRLTAWDLPAEEADHRLRAGAQLLHERGGHFVYGEGDADLAALVLDAGRARGRHIATAESCTGGLVGERLTEIPGSSDVFMGGVVCYDNALKTSLLGVPRELIESAGAVSEEVAGAMARGAIEHCGADLAVAVTGVAGPGGGTAAKPVGTVWIAVADRDEVVTRRSVFLGNRHDIRQRAAQGALHMMYRRLT